MTTPDTTPPRCPSCGAAMVYHSAVMPLPAYYRCERDQISMPILYDVWPKFGEVPPSVPCPSCGGDGNTYVETYSDGDVRATCTLCRGSGVVPPDLAAAWVAAGQRSGGEE